MAPDPDSKSSLRRQQAQEAAMADDSDAHAYTSESSSIQDSNHGGERLLKSIKELGDTEVCIDGIVYDMKDFDHPGGATNMLYGGNDATVFYRMMHPYHPTNHGPRLEKKMKRVGRVVNYQKEFDFDTPFAREIKREVAKVVPMHKQSATPGWWLRATFYLGWFFYNLYVWLVYGVNVPRALLLGVSTGLLNLNVMHDASHGSVSLKNHRINDLLSYTYEFIGGDRWTWMQVHYAHHAFTNDEIRDPDVMGPYPLVLVHDAPAGDEIRKENHRWQWLYAFPLQVLYYISICFHDEHVTLRQRHVEKSGMYLDNSFLKSRRKYAVLLKALHILGFIVSPFRHNDWHWSWSIFGCILLWGFSASWTVTAFFFLSHNFDGSERYPYEEHRTKGEVLDWYKVQATTSSTHSGALAGMLTGGLNYQFEHHYFPHMNSAWYPTVSPVIRRVCEKHGVPYPYFDSVFSNYFSTIRYLYNVGTGALWKEERPIPAKGYRVGEAPPIPKKTE